jgi:WD40 repeat protein
MASDSREPVCATLSEQPMDVCFHPTRALVAAGLITGKVETFSHTAEAAGEVTSRDVHSESCRAVRFLPDGSGLVSAGVDCTLVVTNAETGARIARVAEAHDAAINRLCMLTETLMATGARRRRRRRGAAAARPICMRRLRCHCGPADAFRAARPAAGDDEGHVRLWDTRTRARVGTFRVHEDFIADMHHCTARNTLLTASGDGTLAVLDLRAAQVTARSDNQEDELLSGAQCVGR